MKYYAVIDTNVIVSAMLKWNSVPGNLVQLVFDGPIIPVLNDDILDEYNNVLHRPKFRLTDEIISDVLDGIKSQATFVDAEELELELPDPKDKVFYEVVMEKKKSDDAYLVTGNIRHFPEVSYVVTPRQMLDIIISESEE